MDISSFNSTKKRRNGVSDLSNFVYGKIPPQARELETAVLGAMMLEPICLPNVLNLIFEEVFYVEAHKHIFKAIVTLYDKGNPVDISTVCEQLKNMELLDEAGGPYYVTKLTNDVVSSANIEYHCQIILEKFMAREMIRISGESINEAYDDITDIFELYDRADNQILNIQERVLKGAVKDMNHYAAKVEDQYHTVKQTGVLGIKTGLMPFDKAFLGLVAPDLFIIAARPGMGKTALAISITHSLSVVNNIPGAWFSFEMDGVQLTRRLVSIDSKISHTHIRDGSVSGSEEITMFNSIQRIGNSPVYIEDKLSKNVRSVRTRANILKRKNKIQYIIVDYLQLMSAVDGKDKNRDNIIGEVTSGLKSLAKELEIPVIALSQLSRKVEERSDKMPQLSDLRESGNIEQDADEVLFLMRPEYYGFLEDSEIGNKRYQNQGLCVCVNGKNRHGNTQNFALGFHGETMHFTTHPNDYGLGEIPDQPQYNGWQPSKNEDF